MPRAPLPREVQVSKKIAWLLRHGAEKEGLQLNAAGYANVQDVLSNRNIRSFKVTFVELRTIVESNDKKRFAIIPVTALQDGAAEANENAVSAGDLASDKSSDYLIRANQGHSIAVDSESLLTKIDETNAPAICVHGTTHGAWSLIVASGGLKRMTRQHVHFASGLPAGFETLVPTDDAQTVAQEGTGSVAPVISGMRNSSTVLIFVDVRKALGFGLNFWKSENDVILSEGDASGLIPLDCFSRVEDRTGGQGVLVENGKILKEAPAEWAKKGTGSRQRRGAKGKGKADKAEQAKPAEPVAGTSP